MRILIITMDDPIQTNELIKFIIRNNRNSIVGLAVSKGDRLLIGKNKSKFLYIISLLLIMGFPSFMKNSFKSVFFKLRKKISGFSIGKNPSILEYARSLDIPVFDIKTPNNKSFQEKIKVLKPDLIINQSQSIIKKDLINIPSIGVINRHNALLPKNRGRLTPFWVLFKGERETGVSIHFVNEKIDAGDIIVQEKYQIEKSDNFNTLVKKNYEIAPRAIQKALDLLESGFVDFLPNDENLATYNTIPTLKEAFQYRIKRISRYFGLHK